MPLMNSKNQYGSVTKSFHWLTALIVICLLALGLYMTGLPNSPGKFKIYGLHKSFGITVLALIMCRIIWHIISNRPQPVESLRKWEKRLSTALHWLFYALLIAMPMTGWLMSSASNFPVSVFGLFTLPDLIAPDKALAKALRELHESIGTVIMIAIGLHVAAALKHHFFNKDQVLKRMLPSILALFMFSSAAYADGAKWILQPHESSLTFKGRQMGAEFTGSFDRFRADINFDPDNLAASKVMVNVDISTVNTQSAERDENITGKDWFNVARFPFAIFETTGFRKTGDNSYEASANLTIRDITLPVTLPFKLKISESDSDKGISYTAVMDAAIILDRSKFKLGTGSWADTSVIANEVPVTIHVVAHRNKTAP